MVGELDRVWLAAMIDAEGYMSFAETNRSYGVTIGVVNSNGLILAKLRDILEQLGCSYSENGNKVKNLRVRNIADMLRLLDAIDPWLLRLNKKSKVVREWLEYRQMQNGGGRANYTLDDHVKATKLLDEFRRVG